MSELANISDMSEPSDGDGISKKRVLINTVSSVVTRVLNLAVMVWVIQFFMRRLSPEEYSIYPVVISVMATMPIFSSFFQWGLGRYAAEAFAKRDPERITQICSTIFATLVPVAMVMAVVGGLFAWQLSILGIAQDRVGEARLMFVLLFGHSLINLLLSPFSVGMFVRQRFVVLSVIDLGATCIRILLLAILLLGISQQIIWVVVAQVGSNLCADLTRFFVSRSILPVLQFRRSAVRFHLAREILTYNAWAVVNQSAGFIRDSADPLILTNMATAVDVNTVHPGMVADKQLRSLVLTAFAPVLPVLTTMHATNQHARLQNTFLRGGRLCVWMLMTITVPLIVFRDELLKVFLGPKFEVYSNSGLVLGLLLGTFFFIYPRIMLTKIGAAVARVRAIGICNLGAQTSNLCLTLLLVGVLKMGAVGAALSTFATEAVWHVFVWWPLSIWFVQIPVRRFVVEILILGLLPSLTCATFLEIVRRLTAPDGVFALIGCSAAGLVVYMATILLFCLTAADRADLVRVIDWISRQFRKP